LRLDLENLEQTMYDELDNINDQFINAIKDNKIDDIIDYRKQIDQFNKLKENEKEQVELKIEFYIQKLHKMNDQLSSILKNVKKINSFYYY
jgi:glucan phosphorylase